MSWIKSQDQKPIDGQAVWVTQRLGGEVAEATCNQRFVPVEIWIVGSPYFWQPRVDNVKPEPPI